MHQPRPRATRTASWLLVAVAACLAIVGGACAADGETIDASADEQVLVESEEAGGRAGIDGEEETAEAAAPPSTGSDRLTQGTWTLSSGSGPDGDVVPVDGYPITIVFDGDGSIGGVAGCNGYGATFQIEDASLLIRNLGADEAACSPAEIMTAEAAYFAALADVDAITLADDQVTLTGPSTELVFTAGAAAPIDQLVGRQWLLVATVSEGEALAVEGDPAVFVLNADGTFSGGTGCRELVGNQYQVVGSSIVFTDWGAEGDCPTALRDQDNRVIGALEGGFVIELDQDQLAITSAGDQGLLFRQLGEDEAGGLTGTDVPTDEELLAGIEWVFVGGDSPDGPIADPRTVDPETVITLTFRGGGGYDGVAGCIAYRGGAEIGESLWTFTFTPPQIDDEGCRGEPDASIDAYLAALPAMNEGGISDDGQTLVLNGSEIELLFERVG